MIGKINNRNMLLIGEKSVVFPAEAVIHKIEMYTNVVCVMTGPDESGLDWGRPGTQQLWLDKCRKNPGKVHAYNTEAELLWTFGFSPVTGMYKEIPGDYKETDFVTGEAFYNYLSLYRDKELVMIYCGDFLFRVDAFTGEIYSKSVSR